MENYLKGIPTKLLKNDLFYEKCHDAVFNYTDLAKRCFSMNDYDITLVLVDNTKWGSTTRSSGGMYGAYTKSIITFDLFISKCNIFYLKSAFKLVIKKENSHFGKNVNVEYEVIDQTDIEVRKYVEQWTN